MNMPSGTAKSDELHAHCNYWLRPVFPWLPFNHFLLPVMHYSHNLFDQWFAAVWADIDVLHEKEANLVKHDVIVAMYDMGATVMKPAKRDGKDLDRPSLKGADLSVLRTEHGMCALLELVYGFADIIEADAMEMAQPLPWNATSVIILSSSSVR